jgi:glycosyltransferase involved in cell wall biosynthesis
MIYFLATTEFPPFLGGGISTYCESAAKELKKRGHKVVVLHIQQGKEKSSVQESDGIEIHRVGTFEWSDKDLIHTSLRFSSALNNYLVKVLPNRKPKDRPEVLEITEWGALPYFCLKSKKQDSSRWSFPIIVSSHGPQTLLQKFNSQWELTVSNLHTRNLELFSFENADAILVPSEYAKSQIVNSYSLRKKAHIKIINYPILSDKTKKIHSHKDIDILYFGRKQYIKGFDIFCDAIRGLEEKHHSIASIGGDSWFYNLKMFGSKLARNLRVEDFGLISKVKVNETLARTKVVVLPSRVEWFSYAMFEAVAQNLVIVLPEGLGSTENLSKVGYKNTINYSPNNSKELSKAIQDGLVLQQQSLNEIHPEFNAEQWNDEYYNQIERIFREVQKLKTDNPKPSMKTCMKSISVVIPHYNLSQYLGFAINSLLNAGVSASSIYVVDDGSSHAEVQNVKIIAEKFNVNLKLQNNVGLSQARNNGLAMVETKYVLFLDADDAVSPEYLLSSIKMMEISEKIAGVGASVSLINEKGRVYGSWRAWPPYIPLNGYSNSVNSAGIVWRTASIREQGGFDPRFTKGFEDWDAVNRVLLSGHEIEVLQGKEFIYRVRRNGMFRSMRTQSKEDAYKLIKSRFTDSEQRQIIEGLIITHGPGYAYPNLTSSRLNTDVNRISMLKKIVPFAHQIWSLIPKSIQETLFRIIVK